MTQTPALFDTMAQEVAAYCDRRRNEAQQEAERILAEGRRAADQEYSRGIDATRAEIDAADRLERQRLNAEAEKATLAVQHRVVEEVLSKARLELEAVVQSDRFPAILQALLEEVLKATPGEGLTVLVPPNHVEHIRGWLASTGRGHLDVQPGYSLHDGAAVQDARRTFRVSNTLSGRLNIIQNEARKLCQARLFDQEA